MSSILAAYPNLPLLSLPVAAGLAYAPHFIRALIVINATKKWNNINPRGQLEKVETRMTKAAWAMAKRAEGAHINGIETLPVFYGAVLAALHAGVAKDTVSYYSAFFVVSRLIYNTVYILNTSQITAVARTVVWSAEHPNQIDSKMNLFFGQKAKVTPKDSIVELRNTLQMLEKRETFLQTKIDNELKIAKANATKNRRAALMALKRKKQYEGQIEKISGSRLTIETQVMAIENANVNLETMKAMRAGAKAMEGIHGAMDIAKVDQTMEEIRDQMEIAEEISNVISQPIGFGVDMDEDELAAELDELEQEELDKKLMETERPPQMGLPSVPNHEPEEEDEEEADLRELRESMAIRASFAARPRTITKHSKPVMAGGSSPSKQKKKRGEPSDASDASSPAKKPMFSIFEKKSITPLALGDVRWETHSTSFIVGEAFKPKAGSKVAAFDLDQTLIKVNGKHKWPKNADDWVWWAPGVPEHLKSVVDEEYTIVVITNQGGLDGNVAKQDEMRSKFEKICSQLRLPMWILISMKKDHNRKPMTGLWHWLETKFLESNVEIDISNSYYVGDAAGRHDGWKVGAIKDFNNTDRPGTCEVIVFCGYPAAGKSSFAHKHILPTGQYDYVNQDTLKTKEKCVKAVEESLKNRRAVVVDNTNPDVVARASYVAIAKKYNVPARCFLFMADKDLATHNNYFRAFHKPLIEAAGVSKSKGVERTEATVSTTKKDITTTTTTATTETTTTRSVGAGDGSTSASISTSHTVLSMAQVRDEPARERLSEMVFATYAKRYQEPTLSEGFSEIKKINFVPDEDIRSTWERWYF
ncbi:hypothetical protein BGX27_005891 [Mortierella sp. AM989]|nr:hypothetical protein BGX27_005891 [Mortierella sp. AM989]